MITPKVPDHTWQNAMNVGNELVGDRVADCTVLSIADFFHAIMCDAGTNLLVFTYYCFLICLSHRDRLLLLIDVSNLLHDLLFHYAIFSKNGSKHWDTHNADVNLMFKKPCKNG